LEGRFDEPDGVVEYDVGISAFLFNSNTFSPANATNSITSRCRNLLELVPVQDGTEKQVVLKAVNYYEEGMIPFDAFHAATAETRGKNVLSSENDENIEVERIARRAINRTAL